MRLLKGFLLVLFNLISILCVDQNGMDIIEGALSGHVETPSLYIGLQSKPFV